MVVFSDIHYLYTLFKKESKLNKWLKSNGMNYVAGYFTFIRSKSPVDNLEERGYFKLSIDM